ncbi:MAG: LytTR family DNA-binding domain-containing protein [Defluviitaleaceae bacterium]|nr:LytTR family DNA-binding domain-containing protein [Defluviitaleaceae bacterium]
MLKVFVCEDNVEQREIIEKCIANYILIEDLNMKVVCSTGSPNDILTYFQNDSKVVGLYFLDIDLECDINGIQLAIEIRKHDPRGFIVFVTADADSHLLTFRYKVEAMDYIVKGDINIKENICECIRNAYSLYTAKTTPLQNNFVFNISRHNTIALERSEILYLETSQDFPHSILVHTENVTHQFRGNLSKAASELGEPFFRCHRSIIVNIKKIARLDSEKLQLTLKDGTVVVLADKYVKKVKTLMDKLSSS